MLLHLRHSCVARPASLLSLLRLGRPAGVPLPAVPLLDFFVTLLIRYRYYTGINTALCLPRVWLKYFFWKHESLLNYPGIRHATPPWRTQIAIADPAVRRRVRQTRLTDIGSSTLSVTVASWRSTRCKLLPRRPTVCNTPDRTTTQERLGLVNLHRPAPRQRGWDCYGRPCLSAQVAWVKFHQ